MSFSPISFICRPRPSSISIKNAGRSSFSSNGLSKHNLKIKSFLGTSKNAVLTQIYVALCMYLLLAYLKFLSQIALSLQQILRLLQLNLFERRDLGGLLKGEPPDPEHHHTPRLCLI